MAHPGQGLGPRGFLTDEEKRNMPKVNKALLVRIFSYLKPYLPDIDRKLQKMDHLYPESQIKITCGKHGLEAAGVGAANYFIEKFISSLV